MKIICKVDKGDKYKDFQPYRIVVEVLPEKFYEVDVINAGYSENRYVEIRSGGVALNPKSLVVSCSNISVSELLLHVEICKFILDQSPELSGIDFKKAA